MARPRLPKRPAAGHKGTFGTVLVVGGRAAPGRMMLGAPVLAARGALRAGAGLVALAVPEPLAAAALTALPEATAIPFPVDAGGNPSASEAAACFDAAVPSPDAVVIGPGLGAGTAVQQMLVRILGRDEPVVVDADALTALAAMPGFDRDLRAPAILTPHPGEFDRLAGALELEADARDPAARPAAAAALAARLGCVVVLKGAGTVVSDGVRIWVDDVGSVVLATGGTGDVLAGILGAVVAASPAVPTPAIPLAGPDLFEAARVAVTIHGRAAAAWSTAHGGATSGLLASELADEVPAAMAVMRHESASG